MKKMLPLPILSFVLFSLISCNDSSTETKTTAADSTTKADSLTSKKMVVADSGSTKSCIKPGTDPTQIEYWEIPAADGKDMVRHKGDAGYDVSSVINDDNEISQKIYAKYGRTHVSRMVARYRVKDENCYCEKRKIKDDHTKCGVGNYKTEILVATSVDVKTKMETILYYDCYSICPPPPGCDATTEALNKTSSDKSKKKK